MILNEEYSQEEVQDIFEDMLWQFEDFEYDLDYTRTDINPKLGWLSKHNRKTLGRCHWDGYEYDIMLNPNMLNFEQDGIRTIKNTLAHELCHTLPGCMNHGREFHEKAKLINQLMGYIIDTKADVDSSSYFRKYLPDANYKTVCSNCGNETLKPHMCNEIKNPGVYTCYKCKQPGKIYSYKLNKQTGEVVINMKLRICESNYPQEVKDAIFAYTAQGGNLAPKYPFGLPQMEILKNYLDSNTITLDCNIYRGIWMSDKQWEEVFYNWYDGKNEPFKMRPFNSFTKDEHRAHGYGNGGDVFVLLVIEKGTTLKALDLGDDTMYKEEEEVLVANDTFYIKDIQFQEYSGYNTIVYLTN